MPDRRPLGALDGGLKGDSPGDFGFLVAMQQKQVPIILPISSALFGVGGAYFSLAQFNAFTFGVAGGALNHEKSLHTD